ncbi:flagellar biosynthetic protein FliO [Paenibacillus assamensis]|uniref:flagellar biosynthetic protein FliO n=1 Tax=Paenibacillus assamensis TaxID=311244 RepID=UPI0006880304|nr:flagellar biosynthetic protein FliO [Paenibacillus assamensis]
MFLQAQPPVTPDFGTHTSSVLTVLMSLGLIIVLIVLFIKILSRKSRMWQMNQNIRTLGGTGLGQNKSLQIVEVGGVIYVLGVGDDITVIDKISDEEQVAVWLASFQQQQAPSGVSLPPTLVEWWNKRRGNTSASHSNALNMENESTTTFHEMFQSKLEQLPDRDARMKRLLQDDTNEDRQMDP